MRKNVGVTYVLGDIHGNFKALEDVFRKVNFNLKNDDLIFLGDLADGHNDPELCLKKLLNIKNLIPILGNHDLYLKKWLEKDIIAEKWIKIGGLKTIEKLKDYKKELKIYFDKALPYYIIDDKIFCHGGFNQNRLIIKQRHINFSINRRLFKTAKKYTKTGAKIIVNYDEKGSKKINEIFIGHSPTRNKLPAFYSNLINIDTGAGNGGKLTIMDIDTKRYWQSQSYKL